MQAELVAEARRIGVAMGSRRQGVAIGWTTDATKAEACREAGLSIFTGYNSIGPPGWEIIAYPDVDAVQAARLREDITPTEGTEA